MKFQMINIDQPSNALLFQGVLIWADHQNTKSQRPAHNESCSVWAANTSSSRKHSRPQKGHGNSPNWVNLNGKNIYDRSQFKWEIHRFWEIWFNSNGIKHGNHRCFSMISYVFLSFSELGIIKKIPKNPWISCDFQDVSRLRTNPHLMFDVGSISSPIQRPVGEGSPCHLRGSIVMEVPQ